MLLAPNTLWKTKLADVSISPSPECSAVANTRTRRLNSNAEATLSIHKRAGTQDLMRSRSGFKSTLPYGVKTGPFLTVELYCWKYHKASMVIWSAKLIDFSKKKNHGLSQKELSVVTAYMKSNIANDEHRCAALLTIMRLSSFHVPVNELPGSQQAALVDDEIGLNSTATFR